MRILIADDHIFVRKGVIEILSAEFPNLDLHEASNGEEALEMIGDKIWDLIILDISMPMINGIDTIKTIRQRGIKAPVLVLSMQTENQSIVRAIEAGASGFINKATATEELVKAVYKVLSGRKYISEPIRDILSVSRLKNQKKKSEALLTERENQVMALIAAGKTVTEIARELSVSITAISTYRAHILEKLSLANNAELIRYAMDNKLV
jgi:DNA-binding NarL/FixJ family response regulator